MARFTKVLVANRGEIAVRVIRGARQLGYRTVAVYSDADRDAMHVLEADEAVRIGPAPVKESYLVIDHIIAAAKQSGAEAIHPGYGFLSEREDFAQAVQDAGLVFIGPDPHSIEAMGNKSASKIRMLAAQVPCVPGYQGEDQADELLVAESKMIGLPVMVKAAAGGGGRGMRLVHEASELLASIQSARSEAANAFGNGQLLIEKAVVDARHVEIQVFGDRYGNVVYLGERDCSVQRRNQKVVEEALSPAVNEALRRRMGEAAVAAAKAVNYVGAGTVEFMLARDGQFYFLEMNTRLQVEHPVTELVFGLDLVEWQLRVAQGEKLPLSQEEILQRLRGWAIEVRLCAEDPQQNYLPQTGRVLSWRAPQGSGVRVDTYLRDGQVISPFYDSMQAKIIAWGEDRETARQRLLKALRDTTLLGVVNNRDYLVDIISHEAFASGDFSTAFIGQYFPAEAVAARKPTPHQVALAAVALYMDDALRLSREQGLAPEFIGWHSSHEAPADYRLKWREQEYRLDVLVHDGHVFTITQGGEKRVIDVSRNLEQEFHYVCDGVQGKARTAHDGDSVWIDAEGASYRYSDVTLAPAQAAAAGSDGRLLAHSDGKLVAVHVKPGDRVEKGQTLAVLEAMKMEFQLQLPVAGTVESVSVTAGQQVKNRQVLVVVKLRTA
ncbi:acetyl-CoA carboxylase biotin carboxylase subunit [Solimonas sp. K1W22B-7]|uniref:acetyl/propionyl/methylcrotonyl-CoA carboxylase subunit alpha n=1 Tax=Solimonas sp. K1W22B-7 TaxID=2303331 RepID=UPI000E32DD8B|nr:acetyl-CoA carboxylase biotin carboxylase subunit [Solimonas sp. K1W22B-7]AXQ29620.1 acetyl-CoA carboxylase biotin carboxylase subunit [Solimonas sp. K1W22B-7]